MVEVSGTASSVEQGETGLLPSRRDFVTCFS